MSATFPALSPDDVSHAKIAELLSRLLAVTAARRVVWARDGDEYEWDCPSGVIEVSPRGVAVWDDRGVCHRRFHPGDDQLLRAVTNGHEVFVHETLDRILADLDALAAPPSGEKQ